MLPCTSPHMAHPVLSLQRNLVAIGGKADLARTPILVAFEPLQALAPPLGSSEDLLTSRPSWRPYEHNQRGYDLHCRGQGERHHVARRNVPKHAEDSRSQRKDSLIERHHERDDRTDVGRTKLMLRDKRGKGNNVTDAETKQHATNQYNRGRI